jgi:hypothetical protein
MIAASIGSGSAFPTRPVGRSREAGIPEFSLPNREFQGKDRDRTGIIAVYAFVVSDLPTRPGAFFEGWQGIFDDCLTPKSLQEKCWKMQLANHKNDHSITQDWTLKNKDVTDYNRSIRICQYSN